MTDEIQILQQILFEPLGLNLNALEADQEVDEYSGFNFRLNALSVKYRMAKITPKKVGQFVTLWKRGADGQTQPFQLDDPFDCYIIAVRQDDQLGIFIFPKAVLAEKQILSSAQKEGKRGFRLYPAWDTPTNRQALTSQKWQCEYFYDLTNSKEVSMEKISAHLKWKAH
ncbi:hypothetical protein FAZ15_03330 [Sphingobacterium olei]|uniref:MepB family protein n=1 Tax=Sphingobacterium olei TaxID=2571155 RepID=A0A4U0PK65_9SPHI|nr:MepB family protein [Sphingobacterium olei]TJZ63324.1 hypothetical protein FAZ15_03330 [Sphingobacterium olei]